MSMPEMDDLLDQLEEQVERERLKRRKEEQVKEGVESQMSGTLHNTILKSTELECVRSNPDFANHLNTNKQASTELKINGKTKQASIINIIEYTTNDGYNKLEQGETFADVDGRVLILNEATRVEPTKGESQARQLLKRVVEVCQGGDKELEASSKCSLTNQVKAVLVNSIASSEKPEEEVVLPVSSMLRKDRLCNKATKFDTMDNNVTEANSLPSIDIIDDDVPLLNDEHAADDSCPTPITKSIDEITLKHQDKTNNKKLDTDDVLTTNEDLPPAIVALLDGVVFKNKADLQKTTAILPSLASEDNVGSSRQVPSYNQAMNEPAFLEEEETSEVAQSVAVIEEMFEMSKTTRLIDTACVTRNCCTARSVELSVTSPELKTVTRESKRAPKEQVGVAGDDGQRLSIISQSNFESDDNRTPLNLRVQEAKTKVEDPEKKLQVQQPDRITAGSITSPSQLEQKDITKTDEEPKPPNTVFEVAKSSEETADVKALLNLTEEFEPANEEPEVFDNKLKVEQEDSKQESTEEARPGPSSQNIDESGSSQVFEQLPGFGTSIGKQRKSVILSTHAVGNNVGNDLRLTESELQLGKSKPIWIKDEDCKKCMLCTGKFTLVNRRHHCRCCGRVLCFECCSIRRSLPYMQQDDKKQRVCAPCNSTLDRIELYEKAVESSVNNQSTSVEPTAATASNTFTRKKSVLKNRSKSEIENSQTVDQNIKTEQPSTSDARRSVKFLDGVAPGDELSPTSAQAESDRRQISIFSRPSRSSRRYRDAIAKEENHKLNARWFYCCHDLINGTIDPWRPSELFQRLEENLPVRLVIKRNIHVMLQFTEHMQKKVYVLYTMGFNTIGVDELLIVFEKQPNEKDAYLPSALIRSLMRYSEVCLNPTTNMLDDKNGIRQCANRMSTLFELGPNETEGHNAVALYFYPYQNQDMGKISHPSNSAFRIGLFVQESELPLVKAMPSRFLHRLGMMTSVYPTPIVNEVNRVSVFEPFKTANEMASATILTMFHDFRNGTYHLPKITASYSLIRESNTQICLPVWTKNQIKQMAETSTSLLAWALDLSYQADSLFTCERIDNTFSTRIFMRFDSREVIGAAFVAFATGQKGTDCGFTQTVVEDGIVIRLTSDGFENLLKRLINGDNFLIENELATLEIKWLENDELTAYGSINSPIDGMDLRGFYQYGLLLNRALHANQTFYSNKSKALRLGSVISLNHHRMDPQIQSHFFEACEQLTLWLKTSLEDYVNMLLELDINQISVRIYASAERVGYDLAPWLGLEDAYEEFLKILAEKIVPFLYHLLETSQMDFRAELHLPIISIQPIFSLDSEIPIRILSYDSGVFESLESANTSECPSPTSSS